MTDDQMREAFERTPGARYDDWPAFKLGYRAASEAAEPKMEFTTPDADLNRLLDFTFSMGHPGAGGHDLMMGWLCACDAIVAKLSSQTPEAAPVAPEPLREALAELESIPSAEWPQISRAITLLRSVLGDPT